MNKPQQQITDDAGERQMKPITIYFDTNFFINLSRVDEALAAQTIHVLNLLNVRHVISDLLIWELMSGHNRNSEDERIVSCMNQLTLLPYCTGRTSSWDVLLYSGEERVAFANFLQLLLKLMTIADNMSMLPSRAVTAEQESELSAAQAELMKELGFPETFGKDIPLTMSIFQSVFEGTQFQGLKLPENPSPEEALKLSEQLNELIGRQVVDELEERKRIKLSSTSTDKRWYEVATNNATPTMEKKYGGILRDAQHVSTFVAHRHEIDFLQVDSNYLDGVNRKKPVHRIVELGLADRLFSANDLPSVVDKLSELL